MEDLQKLSDGGKWYISPVIGQLLEAESKRIQKQNALERTVALREEVKKMITDPPIPRLDLH